MDTALKIRNLLTEKKVSQTQLADYLQFSRPFVNQMLHGKKRVSLEALEQICDFLGVTLSEFFQEDSHGDTPIYLRNFIQYCSDFSAEEISVLRSVAAMFPSKQHNRIQLNPEHGTLHVYGKAAAGSPLYDENDDDEFLSVPVRFRDNERYFIIQAKGKSMEPKIANGEFIVVQKDADVQNGEIALVRIIGNGLDEYTIKQFYRMNDKVELRSINKQYAPLYYSASQVASVEKVVHIIREK